MSPDVLQGCPESKCYGESLAFTHSPFKPDRKLSVFYASPQQLTRVDTDKTPSCLIKIIPVVDTCMQRALTTFQLSRASTNSLQQCHHLQASPSSFVTQAFLQTDSNSCNGQAVTFKRGVPSLSQISYIILHVVQAFNFYYSQSQHFARMFEIVMKSTVYNIKHFSSKSKIAFYSLLHTISLQCDVLQIQGAAQAHTCLTLLKLSSFGIRTSLGKRHKRFPKATRLLSFANSSPDSKALHCNFPF